MKRKMFPVLLLIAALVLSGCGNEAVLTSNTEQVEVSFSWWGNDVRNEYTLAAVKEFEKLHPEINVVCHYSDWSGYQKRSDAQMASSTESDVMQINYAWIQQYSPDGDAYYDINELREYIDLSNFSQEELDYGMQCGKLNALPIALNTQTVYINKTIYEDYGLEVPQTWDDLFAAAKVMNGEVYPFGMVVKSLWFFAIAYSEQQLGKRFMNLDGSINYTAEDLAVMIDFYCRLVNEKVIPQTEYYDNLKTATGEYAGALAWISDASNYCDKAIANGYEMVVANYIADAPENVAAGWYAKPATMYAISSDTEHPVESAMLLDFLLNSEEMAMRQGVEKGVPVSVSARRCLKENDMLTGIQYEAFLKMNEFTDRIAVVSPYLENDRMIEAYRSACNAVLYGKGSIEEQAGEFYNTLQSIHAGK